MSKSRGTFITAENYLKHLNPEYLRYYFASKLNGSIEDIDLSWSDFSQRINSELVGKLVNIASRCAKLLATHCDNQLSATLDAHELISLFINSGVKIAEHFEQQQYSAAIRCIMGLTDKANQYLDEKKPWILARETQSQSEMQHVCTVGLNLFKILIIYLKPVLPRMVAQAEQFLNEPNLKWADRDQLLYNKQLSNYEPLLQRVTASAIEQLIEDSHT